MFAEKRGRSLAERYREHRAKRRMKKEEKNRFKMVPDKKKSYKWLMIPVSFVLLLALIVYTLYDNGRIIVDYVTVTHAQIPASFDGYRILQISDLPWKKIRYGE